MRLRRNMKTSLDLILLCSLEHWSLIIGHSQVLLKKMWHCLVSLKTQITVMWLIRLAIFLLSQPSFSQDALVYSECLLKCWYIVFTLLLSFSCAGRPFFQMYPAVKYEDLFNELFFGLASCSWLHLNIRQKNILQNWRISISTPLPEKHILVRLF